MARTSSPDAESADSDATGSRRTRLEARRRHRTRVVVLVIAVLLVVVGAGVAGLGFYRDDAPARAIAPTTTQPAPFAARSGVTDAQAAKKIVFRPLDHAHP